MILMASMSYHRYISAANAARPTVRFQQKKRLRTVRARVRAIGVDRSQRGHNQLCSVAVVVEQNNSLHGVGELHFDPSPPPPDG